MKAIILTICLFMCGLCHSQTYKYYFLTVQSGDKGIRIFADRDQPTDIDTVFIISRVGKNTTYKYFQTMSEAFTALGGAGLEFVQFAGESVIGKATLWKRRIPD